jgi:putative transposase
MVEREDSKLSLARQCRLLAMSRGGLYYRRHSVSEADLKLMAEIDRLFTDHPYFGTRRLRQQLQQSGHSVGRSRVRTLMRVMGIRAVYPKRKLSLANPEHRVYPYLLSGLKAERPNQVWSTDITYIRLKHGFVYLVAIMDLYSRYVLSWRLSTTMEAEFCQEALREALHHGCPEIFNSDQGGQFSCPAFTGMLAAREVRISMDSRGRAFDNIFVERLWRTVKYEEVYLKSYEDVGDCRRSLERYFAFYNLERGHQSLGYQTPAEVHYGGRLAKCC